MSKKIGAQDLNLIGGSTSSHLSPPPSPFARAEDRSEAVAAPAAVAAAPGPVPGANAIGLVGTLGDFLDNIERDLIEKALAQTRYNRTAAADLLGITFRQLRYRMQRLNIQ